MQKPLAISIAICLGFTGCQGVKKSDTWDTAIKVRPGETTRDPDPSNAYADKLHSALADRGVEHKVVVYQYRYTTRLREEAVGTRTAVIYRDDSNPKFPWWLKDDRLSRPVWLPNGDLSRQVSFYLRRKAEVIEEKTYPSQGGSGKASMAFAKSEPKLRTVEAPAPAKEQSVTRIVRQKKAAAPVVAVKKAPAPVVATKPVTPVKAVTRIAKSAPVRMVVKPAATPTVHKPVAKTFFSMPEFLKKTAPAPAPKHPAKIAAKPKPDHTVLALATTPQPATPKERHATPDPVATGAAVLWVPPGVLDPAQQPLETAPRDRHLDELFRAQHGSDYNPSSPVDRRKMQQLQNGLVSRD